MSTRPERSDAIAAVDALEHEGRFLEAIDALTRANRASRDPEIERRLVYVRHAAFEELVLRDPPSRPVQSGAPEPRRSNGVPTVSPGELTPEAIRAGIASGGCLLVPALVPPRLVDRLVDDVDRAFEGYDAHAADLPRRRPRRGSSPSARRSAMGRATWSRKAGQCPRGRRHMDGRLASDAVRLDGVLRGSGTDIGDHRLPGRTARVVDVQGHAPPSAARHRQCRVAPGRRVPREADPDAERLARALTRRASMPPASTCFLAGSMASWRPVRKARPSRGRWRLPWSSKRRGERRSAGPPSNRAMRSCSTSCSCTGRRPNRG